MEVTVGIDIGTTSVKAVAVDAAGAVVRGVRIPHALVAPDADRFEHDAVAAWRVGPTTALAAVSEGLEVEGVTVAAMVPSLCGVDADGIPVTAGLLYGDARGRGDRHGVGVQGEVVGFARWLTAQPGVTALWPAQAVANRALCGVGAIDTSTAKTMMPLFDGQGWSDAVCDELGITAAMLPDLSPGFAPIGATLDGAAVGGGSIDAFAEQLVADARAPGDVLVICGTTLIVWALTDTLRDAPGLWSMPYTVPGLYAIGGASNAGGLFIDRVRALVGDPVGRPNRTDVPVWLPYLRGERTPLHDPHRRAELLDVHLGHGPIEVLRAAHEATGFVVRHHLEVARVEARRLVVVGGGTRSSRWMEALADATGLPVDVAAHAEGAAIGAARIARTTAGLDPDLSGADSWARLRGRVEPRPEWAAACGVRYRRFLDSTRRGRPDETPTIT